MESLVQIFLDCQHSVTSQPKLLKKLINIYLKSDLEKFVGEFTRLLKHVLIHGDKQPVVERTLSFVVKFATADKSEQKKDKPHDDGGPSDEEVEEEVDPFLENLIVFLLNNHEANSPAVRLRICQLLSMLLRQMGAKAAIDNDLYDLIYDTMLHRLQDKIPGVRKEAAMALTRLQDPYNKDCPVVEAYCFHLCKDPNPDVRRAVLNNIAVSYQTLPAILDRTRDVREVVRCQAYAEISQKIHLKSLTIALRVRLISEGLKDRHEMVRNCVKKKLIPSWLRQLDGNVLDLLTCLDVEASAKEAELILKTIFELIPFPDLVKNIGLEKPQRLVNPSDLRPESALYWRCLTHHLRNEGAEEALEEILPDLTHFCDYLSDFVLADVTTGGDAQDAAIQIMERDFIANQLIGILLVYDLSDEVGRRSLDQMVRNLLVSDKVGETLVKGLIEIFSKLQPLSTWINQLAEMISEIREPLCRSVQVTMSEEEERKKKVKIASLKVKINEVREKLQESMLNLDLEAAQIHKNELEELEEQLSQSIQNHQPTEELTQEPRNDSPTLIKCLKIFCNIVECSEVKELTPALQSLYETLILVCLRSEDPAVRNHGVQALGLVCLLSKDLAKQHITLLMQVSKIDVEKIQITALRCVIDCLHLYGIEEFSEATEDLPESLLVHTLEKEDKEKCVEDGGAIIAALCDRLDDEVIEIRTLVVEGLCKLLLSSRITSSKLLSRLVLMFYNPATGDDSFLRHILGVFFPLYALEDASNQESLCEAVMPTLQTLVNAPSHSPLASIDIDNVTNFLISITSPTILPEELKEKVNAHDTLVFTLCTEVLNKPSERLAKIFVRCLNSLNLSPNNLTTLRQLDVLASKIIKEIEGKGVQNTVRRFHQKIKDFLSNAPDVDTPEETITGSSEATLQGVATAGEPSSDKTETTVIRRKRMLYDNQTITDPALFSSEESEAELRSPSKRIAHSPSVDSLDVDSVTFGSPPLTSTQTDIVPPDSQVESNKSVAFATYITPEVNSEVELSQAEELEEVSISQQQIETSSQEESGKQTDTEKSHCENTKSLEDGAETDNNTSLSCESSTRESSSDEEPTPPKIPHLIISSPGQSRRSRNNVLVEETSDSSGFIKSSRASRKAKSLPSDNLHISSSSSTDCISPSVQRSLGKESNSSRKRINTSSDLKSSSDAVVSDGNTSDSSMRRSTRSKSSTSRASSGQSINTSTSDSPYSRVSQTRKSKNSNTPTPERKSQRLSDLTVSTRRSSRNRKSK